MERSIHVVNFREPEKTLGETEVGGWNRAGIGMPHVAQRKLLTRGDYVRMDLERVARMLKATNENFEIAR